MAEKQSDALIVSPVQGRPKFSSRAALLAGFGTLLALMAITSLDSLSTVAAFANHYTQIRQGFVYREHTLERVRTSVYESGDIVSENALTQSDPRTLEQLRTRFQSIRQETTESLDACIQ